MMSVRSLMTAKDGPGRADAGETMRQGIRRAIAFCTMFALVAAGLFTAGAAVAPGQSAGAATTSGPLHTTGTNGIIYDAANQPVRLVGFNWTGTENGGRADNQKTADVCGVSWRTPGDGLPGLSFSYDNLYQTIRDWGYNVLRIPVSWNNLEPVAPVWNASANQYDHSWNQTYLNDLKSMVTKSRAAGLMVILDMHQDYWSPALHHITNWNGTSGYCEGVGMPRWLNPTIDAKATTTQSLDFYTAMNTFYRNIRDPQSPLTNATPWQLFASAWDQISYQFSSASEFAAADAVVGADILNEPYISYVGGSPPAGQTVLQAAGSRLVSFYNALAPAITAHNASWLLFFQDSTGGYNAANPAARESPVITGKPTVAGNWVYSNHIYAFSYGTFEDGVTRHDDFGITVANRALANATAWGVPLYVGEFTNFSIGVDARNLTDATMEQTRRFLSWAKTNRVNWTFWSFVNPYRPMTVVNYTTNQAIPVVKTALATGLDAVGVNAPPIASFTSTCTDLSCSFDGTGSTDSDGQVTSYAWTFGDGATSIASAPARTYAAAGTYPVKLTVTDNLGATATKATSVTVSAPTTPATVFASDVFSRTTTNGWGTADTGGAWTAGGGTSSFSVTGGSGRIVGGVGVNRSAMLQSLSQRDVEMVADVSLDLAAKGSGAYVSLLGRSIATNNDYRLRVRYQSNATLVAYLVRVVNNADTVVAWTNVNGITVAPNDVFRLRFQVSGTTTTTLRAKVWRASAPEPAAWLLSGTDATPASLRVAGSAGVLSYLSSSWTGTPATLRLDNFSAGPIPAG